MRADRMLSILMLLQSRGRMPAAELAKRLEVSVRTVYRDVEGLSAAGVPVWAERGRGGGIHLMPGYRTDLTGLTGDEARALFVLTTGSSHDALGLGPAIASALRKVMAAVPAPHRAGAELISERVLVDPVRWAPGHPEGVELGELRRAVFADRRLRLSYCHRDEETPREYTVDPYGLVSKAGVWYLAADCDGKPQLFRVDRVELAQQLAEPARLRPGVSLRDVWSALREQVERVPDGVRVKVRVRRQRLGLFLRLSTWSLISAPAPSEQGWAEVELGLRALRAVRALLQFGSDVEVLWPPEARAELAAAAAEVAGVYGRAPADGAAGACGACADCDVS